MKKTVLAFLIAISILTAAVPFTALAASEPGAKYSDIQGQWFTDAALNYGYTDIFADSGSNFYPNKKITRMEFVRLLDKALDITINYLVAPDIKNYFSDVKSTEAGASELIDLVTAGIVDKGGSFNPNGQLDRDLMVHWLLKALSYKTNGNYQIPMVKPVPFKDDAKIKDAYRSEVYSAVVLKLVSGRGNNMFAPEQGATRAEAVAVVMRLVAQLDVYNKGSHQSDVAVTASAKEENGALVMSLVIQNNSAKAVKFAHGGQTYDFKLFDAQGNTVYTWSADKYFIMIATSTTIEAGKSITYTETLGKDAWSAIKAQAVSMKAYITGTSDDFKIDPNGYSAALPQH